MACHNNEIKWHNMIALRNLLVKHNQMRRSNCQQFNKKYVQQTPKVSSLERKGVPGKET